MIRINISKFIPKIYSKIAIIFFLLSLISSCMSKGVYEAKTPCVFFSQEIQMISSNPCDFRPINQLIS